MSATIILNLCRLYVTAETTRMTADGAAFSYYRRCIGPTGSIDHRAVGVANVAKGHLRRGHQASDFIH